MQSAFSSQQAMESLSLRVSHRTPDMPSRGMRIALSITNRIPVILHVGTKTKAPRESSAFNVLSDWRGSM
jgi:hypothetical protein